jgi:hypothetical protein
MAVLKKIIIFSTIGHQPANRLHYGLFSTGIPQEDSLVRRPERKRFTGHSPAVILDGPEMRRTGKSRGLFEAGNIKDMVFSDVDHIRNQEQQLLT